MRFCGTGPLRSMRLRTYAWHLPYPCALLFALH